MAWIIAQQHSPVLHILQGDLYKKQNTGTHCFGISNQILRACICVVQVGGAPEVAHFYVLLYLDRLMARPVEVWQVFVHALRKVDMRAMIGQTSQASVVVRGVVSRRVAAYTTHPDELMVRRDGGGGGAGRGREREEYGRCGRGLTVV